MMASNPKGCSGTGGVELQRGEDSSVPALSDDKAICITPTACARFCGAYRMTSLHGKEPFAGSVELTRGANDMISIRAVE